MTHVLIVDDNAQNLYLLRALLQGHGCAVTEARHGAEALVRARQAAPALIVSDLLMPVMDGYTLLRHWKTDAQLKPIPFVVYTATYTDPKDERLALAMGADAFIVKPAEPEQFWARVQAVLARVERGEAPSSAEPLPEEPGLLRDYNEVLVRKLESKAQQLERSNRELLASIAEFRRTEAALHESEERFRATFEHAAVGIAHVDLDGRFLRVNDKLCEIMGHPREALLRLTFFDLIVPDDRAEAEEVRRALLAGTRASSASERRYQRRDGSVFWGNLVSTLLHEPGGEPRYFISVIADVTERRLLQEQFRQAQKLETIGQLTGGVAHDFNNLLTVIIGNAELLVERLAGDPGLQSLAEMTRTAASRGADLTQRLLAFARRQALDPRAVDVNELLRGMDGMLRRMLPEHIEIEFVRGAGLWPALVDASQLESAVLNLGVNARDAMPHGGRLTVETANVRIDDAYASQLPELSPGQYVLVAVSDTGTGIPPEHMARVFDPFFTTKPAGKGTGLGLSMVYGFVKQSGGHVKIYSEPDQGTSVKLYLPRASGSEPRAVAQAVVRPMELRGSESILLVEDDPLVRQYAEHMLLSLGYRVVTAGDGAEAMAVIRSRDDIELLFTDVIMPGGMNGRQLADAALALKPGLKLLFSSGYTENAIVHQGRLEPGVQLLGKPYGRHELARKVRAVLALPGSAPVAALHGRLLILDDDPTVGQILALGAERFGFKSVLTDRPQEFFDQLAQWQPSHVAIDLTMPEMGGRQVMEQLAQRVCTARVVVCSGAGIDELNAALDHGRALGLQIAGALPKPFSAQVLEALLVGGGGGEATKPA